MSGSECKDRNCPICNKKVGFWEYVWGVPFKESLSFVKWSELLFIGTCLIIGWIALSYFGLVLAWIFVNLMGNLDGGAVFDINNDYPEEVFPPNVCSAGIEDCQICNNEYSHEFNVEYNKKYKKWYNII